MPLSNIEQAITNVLATKQVPDYNNVFDAYTGISRLPFDTFNTEGPLYFDRAIGKYRAPGEKGESPFAEYVSTIRRQCMQQRIELISSYMPFRSNRMMCPCFCGEALTMDQIRRKLELIEDEAYELEGEDKSLIDRTMKSKKTKTRRMMKKNKPKKRAREVLFDPYAPSTSTVSI